MTISKFIFFIAFLIISIAVVGFYIMIAFAIVLPPAFFFMMNVLCGLMGVAMLADLFMR